MIKVPIELQDLRRRLYVKAKAEPPWRFWGLYVHVCKRETLRQAYRLAKENAGAPGIDGVTFGEGSFDMLGFTHFWARSRKGRWVVRRKSAKGRFGRGSIQRPRHSCGSPAEVRMPSGRCPSKVQQSELESGCQVPALPSRRSFCGITES